MFEASDSFQLCIEDALGKKSLQEELTRRIVGAEYGYNQGTNRNDSC